MNRASALTGRAARVLFLVALGAFFVIPLWWLLVAPTKTDNQISTLAPLAIGSLGHVRTTWDNLMSYNDSEVLVWLWNSVVYAVASVALAVVVAVPAGYALAVYRFRGRRALLLLTLIGMVLPAASLVLPLFKELYVVGLTNTRWSVILPSAFFPFGVYLAFLHFSSAFPPEIVESAKIDGASDLRVFWAMGVPLAKPAIGLVTFFAFVSSWNNFFLPYVMLINDRLDNLQVGLSALLGAAPVINYANESNLPIHKPEAALAALLSVIPIALVFLVFQRLLRRGILAGSVKG